MQLVQQIQIKRSSLLDEMSLASKNLFNVATYVVRQHLFKSKTWLRYGDLWNFLKEHDTYLELKTMCGSHPPQQVLKQVDWNFKSFFQAMKKWKKTPSKFHGKPKLPKYLKKNGRNIIYFTSQQCRVKKGYVVLTDKVMKRNFPKIKTNLKSIQGVRVVPFHDRYKIDLIYSLRIKKSHILKENILGVDLGINNIITASNNVGEPPLIIKGGIVKSLNQFYNKQLAMYKSLATVCNDSKYTHRIQRLHRKRSNKINDFFHKISRIIINYCIAHNIGTIVIGYNKGWKQNIKLGKKKNQTFVLIPFLKLIRKIEYKAEMVGITVMCISEEYTSQTCSSCGVISKSNRIYRGLYACKTCGMVLNADVNACKNIIKKGIPKSNFKIGDRGGMTPPVVLKICQ